MSPFFTFDEVPPIDGGYLPNEPLPDDCWKIPLITRQWFEPIEDEK